ncbi:MipA/OmpV family protein [Klebsiella pneumoniae]|uniref:MipA/OmpV family protein n=1 Tax=Klebsiella pneumoniae TaxID=573 RepID=UPI0031CC3CAC
MTKIKLLALGVLIATSASAAHADGKFTLGAGVGVVEHPYKQYDADVYPVPVISYESENFWFHGLGGGYYLWNDTNGNLTLTPGIGVEWNSDNQNEYYYGVSRHESRRSGMRSYDPDSSWNPYLELSANYRFLGDWSVYGVARYTRLSDEITDSPMVDKSWSGLISTGITYTF